ncbi:hypothetical protein BDR05DRAFT_1056887 [Suillus weaverae]|nr:hypothetical protein BDR05DRAFT_1063868 [Suillus weaverae]KAG2347406.1 hypothetical protein BDR05DRAFT_1056887 [Suillus weaverae]
MSYNYWRQDSELHKYAKALQAAQPQVTADDGQLTQQKLQNYLHSAPVKYPTLADTQQKLQNYLHSTPVKYPTLADTQHQVMYGVDSTSNDQVLAPVGLHDGARRYDKSIEAVKMMITRSDSANDMQIRKLREQCVSPSVAEGVIRQVIDYQLDTAPLRLINTATGLLCDREAQISIFEMSIEYKELL